MPRYLFDVHEGGEARDSIKAELPGLKEARREAMQIARSYAGRPEMDESEGGAIIVTVRDQADAVVLTTRLVFNVEAGA